MPGCFENLDLSVNQIELARQRAAAGGGYIDLTSSNPTHQGLVFPAEVLRNAAETYWDARRYDPDPRGNLAARQAIAAFYAGRTPSLDLPDEAIFITASTSEAYSLLFTLLADPGDNILAPNVTYPLFEYLAEVHRLELRFYDLDEQRGWQIDGPSLLTQADTRTRAVLIVSPHNPTGAIIHAELPELSRLGLPLICDEVFATFTYRVPATPPIAALHPDLPVFTLNGISKMFALPDLKLGWIALNPLAQIAYADRLDLLNDTFLGANSLTQAMLPALFAQGADFVTHMAAQVRANFDLALARCAECPTMELRAPDGGYYLFPAIRGWDDEEELALFLLEHGVLVHPGYFYGDVPGVYLMLSALTEPTRFAAGLERLCMILNRQKPR
jgi:aspartate/methionine/tyrosine aminotransferase